MDCKRKLTVRLFHRRIRWVGLFDPLTAVYPPGGQKHEKFKDDRAHTLVLWFLALALSGSDPPRLLRISNLSAIWA
jgi:hypothetical protein